MIPGTNVQEVAIHSIGKNEALKILYWYIIKLIESNIIPQILILSPYYSPGGCKAGKPGSMEIHCSTIDPDEVHCECFFISKIHSFWLK